MQIQDGGIGVIPTDTIYGLVGSALIPEAVEKIYKLKKREVDKPFIILISRIGNLKIFGIELTEKQKEFLEKNWPNPLSVVLPVLDEKWKYLHRGTNSLAFRIPKNEELIELIDATGPLVAPSANIEGAKPSETIDEAKAYFGNFVDFYVDGGEIKSQASTIVEFEGEGVKILRQGSFKI